jgi:hypothetical protein
VYEFKFKAKRGTTTGDNMAIIVVLELDIPPLNTIVNQRYLNNEVNLHEKIRIFI